MQSISHQQDLQNQHLASKQSLQPDEVLSVERLPFDETVELARRGEIRDAKSVCALLRAAQFLDELS